MLFLAHFRVLRDLFFCRKRKGYAKERGRNLAKVTWLFKNISATFLPLRALSFLLISLVG